MASDYFNAPDLADTSDRQAALRRYHILDTEPEKDFDRITSLVAKVCDVSTALITLIDEERQWFKSCFNFDARETDIGISFCVHAVHEGEMLVVEDATQDPRFKDNPIVTGPPHIRFYAGAPLTTPEGIHIGTLCIIDYEPQPFDAAQREILDRLSDVVVNQFELRSAEAQIRQLVDQNPQPMYVYAQSDDTILHANAAARDLYGHDEFSSLTASDLTAPAKDQPSSEALSMHERADGSFFPVRLRTREVLFDGRPAVLAVPQSVSERHDTDTTVFFQTDLEGTTQSLSDDWTAATGFSIADTVGGPLLDFVHPLDRSSTADVFSSLLDGEIDACQHEADFLTENGAQAFELHARLVRDANGEPTGTTGTLTPIIEEESDAPSPSEPAPATSSPAPPTDAAPDETSPVEDQPENAPDDMPVAEPEPEAKAETRPEQEAPAAGPADTPSPAEPTDESEGAPEADAADDQPVAPDETPDSTEPATDEDDASSGGVFSTDLPSFANTGPSSPSAPVNGPADDPADDTASASDDGDAPFNGELSPEPFDLAAQLRAVLDAKGQVARQQNVALRRSLPDDPLPVRLDPEAVRHVVDGLLDAALTEAADLVTVRAETGLDRVSLSVEVSNWTAAEDLTPLRQRVAEMDGDLSVEEENDGPTQLVLSLPRSSAPNGDGHSSILSSESPAG